jgi:hypothetical protein
MTEVFFTKILEIINRLIILNIKRCFNKASLNCLSMALLILIYASLQAFGLSICSLCQHRYLIIVKPNVLSQANNLLL